MDFTVFLSARALSDLQGAVWAHTTDEDPRAGGRLANCLLDQALSLREDPERGRVVPEFHQAGLREIRDDFERVIYRVNRASRSINIVRILLDKHRWDPPEPRRLPPDWAFMIPFDLRLRFEI